MKTLPPAPLLASLSQYLALHMGLHIPPEQWRDLAKALESAAKEFGFPDLQSCGEWLLGAPLGRRQIEVLAGDLTVGESYFFREMASFEAFQTHILPEIIQARRGTDQRLRIWSAGCCTGEEPYSIAMILRQSLPDIANWNITLLATDITPRFLEKAKSGIYSQWSFRAMPQGLQERHFHRVAPGRWKISDDIRNMVTFTYLNLAEDAYPSLLNATNAMDVIFCRNVLMYFTTAAIEHSITGFHHSLVDDGWLIVSPSEVPLAEKHLFESTIFPRSILHRKGSKPQTEAPLSTSIPPAIESSNHLKLQLPTNDPFQQSIKSYEAGRYEEALNQFENISSPSNQAERLIWIARCHANQGRLNEGLAACEQAILFDKLNPACHYLRAAILQEQQEFDKANTAFKHALYLDPSFVLAHVALGNLAQAKGSPTEAQKHFQNALVILSTLQPDQTLPESDGLTVRRLTAIINRLLKRPPKP